MLSHYGWLMLHGDVDDPATEKHGGDVYIHKDDIVDGESLCPGDIVSFYLYSDDQGLGAEMCQVEQPAGARSGLNAGAKEFAPGGYMSVPLEPIDVAHVADVFLRLSYAFSSDDEDEDEESSDEEYEEYKGAPSSDGSTHGGATSDSEEETAFDESSDSETESCSEVQWRPPPGLSLEPIGLTAPPGLLPPGLEGIEVC